MLVTIFILALVLTIVTEMFILLLRASSFYERQASLVLGASTMTQRFADVAREARGVEASRTVDGTLHTSDGDTIILRLASTDASGDTIANTFDYFIFTQDPADASRLLEITDADAASARSDATRLLGEHVQEFVFTYTNADPVNAKDVAFALTLRDTVGTSTVTHTLTTYAKLRNT